VDILSLPSNASVIQRVVIAEKRQRLLARVSKFNEAAYLFTAGFKMTRSSLGPDDPHFCSEETGDDKKQNKWRFWQGMDEEADCGLDDDEVFIEANPEDLPLWMPSAGGGTLFKEAGLEDLVKEGI
jgi:hypothetical protein